MRRGIGSDGAQEAQHDLGTYALFFHHATERALLVSETEESQQFWLPKSQIDTTFIPSAPSVFHVEVPFWLAKAHGLV